MRIHLYGGLLCAPYLIIFGFSSLHFNHPFAFVGKPSSARPVEWQEPLAVAPNKDNEAVANAVRDRLNLIGWTIPWQMKRDAAGNLAFDLERPGKAYKIRVFFHERRVTVEERRKGFWTVFNALHALEQLPNSSFTSYWGYYTELCTAFVLFAAASGLYLWVNSRRERWAGIITFLAATLLSVGLILYAVWRG